jgi:methylated-DNA-[protein]-cysteine S-methyltransferase
MFNFSEQVFKIVRKIPRGEFLTYKKVAKLSGSPRAFRAVGNILNKNPDPRRFPCHRVIRSDGRIGGYRHGTKRKIDLLKKEGIIIDSNGKVTPRPPK